MNCCSYADEGAGGRDGKLRFWRNTSIATLAPGQTATLPPDMLGYEWDEDLDNGARPPGSMRLSSTTRSTCRSTSRTTARPTGPAPRRTT